MYRIYIFFIIIVTLIANGCNSVSPFIGESEDQIYSWQMDPEFSNDGETIAFKGLYDSIYAVHFINRNGDYLGKILENKLLSSPSWNPNNDKIAVSVEGNIIISDILGDSTIQLTFSGQDFSPSWSKDGKYIAYTKSICDPDCGIAIYDFSTKITKVIGEYGGHASWSSSPDRIYFYQTAYDKKPGSDISNYKGFVFKRINISTLKIDSLFFVPKTNSELWLEDCTISIDEKEILFAASEGAPPQIYIWKINLEDNTLNKMTVGNNPAFSPDGLTIVYTNTAKLEGGIWIMNSDGSNKRRFTKLNK